MSSSGKKTSMTFNTNKCKYIVKYDGKSIETTVTDSYLVTDNWVKMNCTETGKATVVGMATHITPFKSKRYNFKVATLQLYIDEKCLILKLSRTDQYSFPSCLRYLSRDSKFIFAGIQDEERSDYLRRKYDFVISNGLDILEAARMRWPSKFGKDTDLKVVARELADVDLEQPLHVLQSNWKTSMLCLEQVEFATMEAYASYCVGHKLIIGD